MHTYHIFDVNVAAQMYTFASDNQEDVMERFADKTEMVPGDEAHVKVIHPDGDVTEHYVRLPELEITDA